MKRILLFIAVLISFEGFSQSSGDTLNINGPSTAAMELNVSGPKEHIILPPSPTAASLGQYGSFPVSNYTGTPTIAIPLGSVSGRQITVPVTLNYHASGIRVQQMSSWVGLGWSLSAGGVITRSVHGLADEFGSGLRGSGSLKTTIQNYINCRLNTSNSCNYDYYGLLQNLSYGGFDSEPDVYNFNFMGMSGTIVFDYDGVPQIIPFQKMKIEYDKTSDSFTITDDMGTRYLFSETEEGWSESSTDSHLGNPIVTTAWYLKRITTIHGEQAEFTYVNESVEYEQPITFLATYENKNFPACNSTSNPVTVTSRYFCDTKVLQKISTINEEIIFETAANSYVPCYEDTDAGIWNVAEPLRKVIKKDKQGNIEKTFELTYSCFPNSSRRLRLDAVAEIGSDGQLLPPHTFDYYETPNMPGWVDDHQDYWGYNNGETCTNGYYISPEPNTVLFGGKYTNLLGYNREPNALEVMAFTLKKIIFPTGGFTEFEFEINDYSNTVSGQNKIGGGIRLKKLTSNSGTGRDNVKKFDYKLTSDPTTSSGSIISLPIYSRYSEYIVKDEDTNFPQLRRCQNYQRSSNPKNNMRDTQGRQVGYREVTIFEGENGENGKTLYKYTSPFDFSDVGVNAYPYPPFTSNDHKRGLLTERLVYERTNTGFSLQNHVINSYELNESANRTIRTYVKAGLTTTSFGKADRSSPFKDEFSSELFEYKSEWTYLKSTTTLDYFGQSATPIESIVEYTYNPFNLQPKTIKQKRSDDRYFTTTNTYPNELNLSLLTNAFIISVPIESKKEIGTRQVYKEVSNYTASSSGVPIMTSKYTYPLGDEVTTTSKITMNYKYDVYGNVTEVQKGTLGVVTSYIWGYNNSRPIVEGKNISYQNLLSKFAASGLTVSEFTDNTYPTAAQKVKIKSFLSSLGSNTIGTFITYDLIKGVTTTFTPNGLETSYEYDSFNRLKFIKDNNGKYVKSYQYGFKGVGINP